MTENNEIDVKVLKRIIREVVGEVEEAMKESDYRGTLRLDIDLQTGRVLIADYF